jgi:hypothetical protein
MNNMKTLEERESDLINKGWFKHPDGFARQANPYINPILYYTLIEAEGADNSIYNGSGYSC